MKPESSTSHSSSSETPCRSRSRRRGLCAIEIAIAAQHQAAVRIGPIGTIEDSESSQSAVWFHLKRRACLAGAASYGRPVKATITAFHQSRTGAGAIGAVEGNQIGELAIDADFENSARHRKWRTHGSLVAFPSVGGRAVKISIAAEH